MDLDIFINDKKSVSKKYSIDIKEKDYRDDCYYKEYIHGNRRSRKIQKMIL